MPPLLVSRIGVRARLMLLVLVATIPLFLLLLCDATSHREEAIEAARQRVMQGAQFGAAQEGALLREVQVLLPALAHESDIAFMRGVACADALKAMVDRYPHILMATVLTRAGSVACNSSTAGRGVNVADRSWFRATIGADGRAFALGRVQISRLDGQLILVAAAPLPTRAPGGGAAGVLAVSLDLRWFSTLASTLATGPGQTISIVDTRDGTMVARSVDAQRWVGWRLPMPPEFIEAGQTAGSGVLEMQGFDGKDRIVGYAGLPGSPGIVLRVTEYQEDVLAVADRMVLRHVAIAIFALLLALALAWRVAVAWQLNPLQALSDAAHRFDNGDLEPTLSISLWQAPEFRALAEIWNRVSSNLRTRNQQIIAARDRVARSEAELRLLAENSSDILIRLDTDLRRVYVSDACRRILLMEPAELVGSANRDDVHPDDLPVIMATLHGLRAGGEAASFSFRQFRKDGAMLWLESNVRRLRGDAGFVMVSRDITPRKQAEMQIVEANRLLEMLAAQDGLTGLANRRKFDAVIEQEMRRARRSGATLSLVLIDVDCFKSYNDKFGHLAGDTCLRTVAEAVRGALRRPGDLAARYGGEEIAVVLPDIDEVGAVSIAEHIRETVRGLGLEHPDNLADRVVTISAGIATLAPVQESHTPEDLIEPADHALYTAKSAGRNRVCSPSDQILAAVRQALNVAL
jgi:diguanylate cyclase (GGDEF)-like protein/PAS domain S-box-containing protein